MAGHTQAHVTPGDLPIVNVTHLFRTAKEEVLLTVGDRGLSASTRMLAYSIYIKGIRIFKT